MAFLPVSRQDMKERGWEEADFVLVTGDAYVDHPSFGHAIISRVLESRGYRVAILAQPDWKSPDDFQRFGRPRLGFLINAGNVDSMVNHYSVFKHKRKVDSYSPGGKAGRRPDRAVTVYSNRAREAYGDVPVIIGGLEASLRRFAHYDYWEDGIRRSVLLDSKADLLIYGMGERAVLEIAEALEAGIPAGEIRWIRGTVYRMSAGMQELPPPGEGETLELPSYEQIRSSRKAYGKSFRMQYENSDFLTGATLFESYETPGDRRVLVVQNPPQEPLSQMDLDDVYQLAYEGNYHPMYEEEGGVPAIQEVKFSVVSSRGCFGGCAFCALTYHQGRRVTGRSMESVVEEARRLTGRPDFKGYIHDVGGPTANFRGPSCQRQNTKGVCRTRDCLYPVPCKQMQPEHGEYMEILRAVRELPKVKKVFVRSGIRYDYILADPEGGGFLEELCRHHVSGTLKVAPEHISPRVLGAMRKPAGEVFLRFSREFQRVNRKLRKKQYLIPYWISSHPGSTLEDAVDLALFLKKTGFVPDQVQDFYPTPGTLATCMYYTEEDPMTGRPIHVPKDRKEKQMQRALLHFHKPENRKLVEEALKTIGREDLIQVLR